MITIRDSLFHIEAAKIPEAFEAVRALAKKVAASDFLFWLPETIHTQPTFELFMETMGYSLRFDPDSGHVTDIYTWEDIDYGGEEFLFAALAPFVTPGCYLDIQIDDDFYRWEFDGHYLMEFRGEICYTSHGIVRPQDFDSYALPQNGDELEAIPFEF